MTSTFEIGKQLVLLCKQGKNLEAVNSLYALGIVSIETAAHGPMPARMEGIDAIRGKNQWWIENHTVHSADVSGPFPHGDRFIVHFKYDVTSKAGPMAGQRMQM